MFVEKESKTLMVIMYRIRVPRYNNKFTKVTISNTWEYLGTFEMQLLLIGRMKCIGF